MAAVPRGASDVRICFLRHHESGFPNGIHGTVVPQRACHIRCADRVRRLLDVVLYLDERTSSTPRLDRVVRFVADLLYLDELVCYARLLSPLNASRKPSF